MPPSAKPGPSKHVGASVRRTSNTKVSNTLAGDTAKAAALTKKTTTIRLDPAVRGGLALLQPLLKKPVNKIVNEALLSFIDLRTAELESDAADLLRALQAYRRSDPGFKRAIRAVIEAEVAYRDDDPVEGTLMPPAAGPVLRAVRDVIRG